MPGDREGARAARWVLRIGAPACAAMLACVAAGAGAAGRDPVREVNTFSGTQGEGNTFPGAAAAFGRIQVSPITGDDGARGFAPISSFRSVVAEIAAPPALGHNGPRASVAQLDRAAAF